MVYIEQCSSIKVLSPRPGCENDVYICGICNAVRYFDNRFDRTKVGNMS